MDDFSLLRVLWLDGDIITQAHFDHFEKWIERLNGLSNQHFKRYGLFRNPILQEKYNRNDNIIVHLVEETQYKETSFRIDIERFLAVNPFGRFLKIDERQSFNVRVQLSKRSDEGFIMLYLKPVAVDPSRKDNLERLVEEVQTGARLYPAPLELSSSNDENEGVPIMRFRLEGGHLDRDLSFIPFGLHIDSSTNSLDAWELFFDRYKRYRKLITDYMESLVPSPDFMLIWSVASQLFRLVEAHLNIFKDSSQLTLEFFRSLQVFVASAKAELVLLNIGYEDDYLRQQTADIIEILDKPAINIAELQYDLTLAFQQANDALDALMKYLEFLPSGPVSEKALPVDHVELSRVAGSNKLTVFLESEVEFKKGETLMNIYLRSYSKSEPSSKNVRVSLGDVPQAMLKDLRNALKPIPGENLSYRIECPREVINRDTAKIITIYLPTPLGEGVPDLKRYLSINIRESSNV